jgi:hypothetical protein
MNDLYDINFQFNDEFCKKIIFIIGLLISGAPYTTLDQLFHVSLHI